MDLPELTSTLARTPAVLLAMLSGLPSHWSGRNDGPGTWSAYDIVGHLENGELTDWMPRTRMILESGPTRAFEPVDREAMLRREPVPMEALLLRFQAARLASLDALAGLALTESDLARRGRHPELGEVTLAQLLATWVAHDLTHIGQVGEVLARRLRDDVGPWRAYLPALERAAAAE